jgi:hypothetical protein
VEEEVELVFHLKVEEEVGVEEFYYLILMFVETHHIQLQ